MKAHTVQLLLSVFGSLHQTILVTGATGNQGGAIACHLLQRRFTVRDPNKPAAQALKQAGAELVEGDFSDRGNQVKPQTETLTPIAFSQNPQDFKLAIKALLNRSMNGCDESCIAP